MASTSIWLRCWETSLTLLLVIISMNARTYTKAIVNLSNSPMALGDRCQIFLDGGFRGADPVPDVVQIRLRHRLADEGIGGIEAA